MLRLFRKYPILLFIFSIIIACSNDRGKPLDIATSNDTRYNSKIISSITELRKFSVKDSKWPVKQGSPISDKQKPLVRKLLSEDFLELYQTFNGITQFGVLFELYSIDQVHNPPEQDLRILEDMQAYFPQLIGNPSDYSCLGSGNTDVAWFHRPSKTIFVCHGGESLDSYPSLKDWLLAVEKELLLHKELVTNSASSSMQ